MGMTAWVRIGCLIVAVAFCALSLIQSSRVSDYFGDYYPLGDNAPALNTSLSNGDNNSTQHPANTTITTTTPSSRIEEENKTSVIVAAVLSTKLKHQKENIAQPPKITKNSNDGGLNEQQEQGPQATLQDGIKNENGNNNTNNNNNNITSTATVIRKQNVTIGSKKPQEPLINKTITTIVVEPPSTQHHNHTNQRRRKSSSDPSKETKKQHQEEPFFDWSGPINPGFQFKNRAVMAQNTEKYLPIFGSIPSKQPNKGGDPHPIKVRVLLFDYKKNSMTFRKDPKTALISDEVLNICMDGFDRSPYFELMDSATISDDPDYLLKEEENIVWVVDLRRLKLLKDYTIPERLIDLVNNTIQYQNEKFGPHKRTLKVIYMDWRDHVHSLCSRWDRGKGVETVANLLGGWEHARVVTQQLVERRAFNRPKNFSHVGVLAKTFGCFGDSYPVLQVPYVVRSDYAENVQRYFANYLADDKNASMSASDTIRPLDVAHFWSIRIQKSSKLRNIVTYTVQALNGTEITIKDNNDEKNKTRKTSIQALGGSVSKGGATGRTSMQDSYVQALMTTKIVVTAQRDSWEDHYRLFEALIGGGLVFTDPMLTLPVGYVDRENIIIYHSRDELRQLIIYYLEHPKERLAIARKGWELAMTQHRTYHWMERVFFGKPLSP